MLYRMYLVAAFLFVVLSTQAHPAQLVTTIRLLVMLNLRTHQEDSVWMDPKMGQRT